MHHIASRTADLRTIMPRHGNPKELTINLTAVDDRHAPPDRPISSPIALEGIDLSTIDGGVGLTSLPPLPASPPDSSPSSRKTSAPKSILNTLKNRSREVSRERSRERSSQDRQRGDSKNQTRRMQEQEGRLPESSSMSKIYHLRKAPGSTPELSLVSSADSAAKGQNEGTNQAESRPQPSPHPSEDSTTIRKKDKAFRNPLTRSRSIRSDSQSKARKPSGLYPPPPGDQPPNSAPLTGNWPNAEMGVFNHKNKNKDSRGKSADRAVFDDSDENAPPQYRNMAIHGPKEKPNAFVSGSKNVLGKAKSGGGMFLTRLGKMARSSSHSEKEVPDAEYVLKVITLPLIEQTRATRISKKIEASKDKTEFWMPSLPWRCIDYLNLNCESEGLYRVPGSGPQVKHWQRRFDQELDVDLLSEQELYDPNTIGSMLKTWLRELPSEIFPQELQHSLAVELQQENPNFNMMGQPAPQKLRDALSELPPFNYYLLFAITCHLSLLLSHQERNRMDLNNLSICIGPCLNLERWLFNYLVGDWRNCWQGCWTEKQQLDEEKRLDDPAYMPPTSSGGTTLRSTSSRGIGEAMNALDLEERAVSSGGESGSSGRQNSLHDGQPRRSNDSRLNQPQQLPRNMGSSRTTRPSAENVRDASGRASSGNRHREPSYVPASMRDPQPQPPMQSYNGNGTSYATGHRPAHILTQQQDQRRPTTANTHGSNPSPREGSVPAVSTTRPYRTHRRSQSDLPLSPSHVGFPEHPR
ncbi:hypothetical protein Q7P37_002793 [Cladosporium fusiforme]